MQVTYELTQRDFVDSFIAHHNRRRLERWSYRVVALFFFILAAMSLLLFVLQPTTDALPTVGPVFWFAACGLILLWVQPRWAARNQFSKQPRVQSCRTLVADTAGIHLRWSGGSSDLEWKNFIRWFECKSNFLLYSSPASFDIVPKRAFSPEQLSEFRGLLAQNISAK